MRKKLLFLTFLLLAAVSSTWAAKVTVKMNTRTYTMKLASKATGEVVAFDSPATEKTNGANTYVFNDLTAGTYVLTGIGYSGSTQFADMGTLELNVTEDATQTFSIGTLQIKAANSGWTFGTDYTIENPRVLAPDGTERTVTIGTTPTQGYAVSMLYIAGDTPELDFIPSATRQAEGYETLHYSKKQTGTSPNETATLGVPWFSVTAPTAAHFELSFKPSYADHTQPSSGSTGMAHYVPFVKVEPESTTVDGDNTIYTYRLQHSSTGVYYAYRTWMDGKGTLAGRISKYADPSKDPKLTFTTASYDAVVPTWIDHDVTHNSSWNVANVLFNVNERGHLKMNVGDTKDLLAQRDWQIFSTVVENYFLEPDYHFTVVNLNGQADESVVRVSDATTHGTPWTTLEAVGNGTALVLVTYDAFQCTMYNGTTGTSINWSAIWPENTGVFVVTVGDGENSIERGMTINAGLNPVKEKIAGDNVDAEHDVFYYLEGTDGAEYTFTPTGVSKVEIAYPTIGTNAATYNGFGTTGVTANADGSYTVLLKHGRNIVRLSDASGHAEYQVLTAKPCTRTVTNVSKPGATPRPGDKVNIQYSGLFHPANKMSAVYNNSAYITYNGIEGGVSLYESPNQYTFASAASAQLYGVQIPEDIDVEAQPEYTLSGGCICVTGYGDPFGNHRVIITKDKGLNANLNAVSHKSYMGSLPPLTFALAPAEYTTVRFRQLPAGATIALIGQNDTERTAVSAGTYKLLPGHYRYTVSAPGYGTLHSSFRVADGTESLDINPHLSTTDACWDGTTQTEPAQDADGVYQIGTAAELAWLAAQVTGGTGALNAVLTANIDLGNQVWSRIGDYSNPYKGIFDGQNHTVRGLYVTSTLTYQGLFGYVNGGTVKNLIVEGLVEKTNLGTMSSTAAFGGIIGGVTGGTLQNLYFRGSVIGGTGTATATTCNQYVGGIVGTTQANTTISHCGNEGYVYGYGSTGGVTGFVSMATSSISDSYNLGYVSGVAYVGGIDGNLNANGIKLTNVYNYGDNIAVRPYMQYASTLTSTMIGSITGCNMTARLTGITNAFATDTYNQDTKTTKSDAATVLAAIEALKPAAPADAVEETYVDLVDGTPYTRTADAAVSEVTYTRTFQNTNWQALYLPFDLPAATLAQDFDVARMNDVHQWDDDEDGQIDRTALEVIYQKAGTVKAHTPYLIRAKEAGEKTITVQNVTLKAAEQRSLDCTSIDTRFTFTGTYDGISGTDMYDNQYFAMAGGNLRQANSSSVALGAFRWYLSVTDRDGNPKQVGEVKFSFGDEDDTLTAVKDIDEQIVNGKSSNGNWYDLSGRQVSSQAQQIVKPGLYIRGTRKVFVK